MFYNGCKSKEKESKIESVQSHQETSDLIEKGIKYFFQTMAGKTRNLSREFACGTGKSSVVHFQCVKEIILCASKQTATDFIWPSKPKEYSHRTIQFW